MAEEILAIFPPLLNQALKPRRSRSLKLKLMTFLAIVTSTVFPALGTILALLAPAIAGILQFAIPRLSRLPRYVHLLRTLYRDANPGSQARKYATAGLLALGGMMSFVTYTIVPGTALPIVGATLGAIALVLAVVVSLATLDLVFQLNEAYYLQQLVEQEPDLFVDLLDDLEAIHSLLDRSLEKVKEVLTQLAERLDKLHQEHPHLTFDLDNEYWGYVKHLLDYISGNQQASAQGDWGQANYSASSALGRDIAASASVGAATGVGASAIASSVFVQAGFWTTIQGALGLSSGIAVGATAYAVLTAIAPVGLGILATAGTYQGVKSWQTLRERENASAFLADIILAALPMAWADGVFATEEEDLVHRLLLNPALLQSDRDRVYEHLHKPLNFFRDILPTSILANPQATPEQQAKTRAKYRLLLAFSWQIALADNAVGAEELELYNRMAGVLRVPPEEAREIRILVGKSFLPSYG